MAYYTASQYATYLSTIKGELGTYGQKLATQMQYGHKPDFAKQVKFMLLEAFVEIADWYLGEYDDPDNNGMTIAEFNTVQDHISKISKSYNFIVIE